MGLEKHFDAVLMLTWSNWKTEPRSNRYHYATRFARSVQVMFVQPWATPGTPLRVEGSEIENLDIVHATSHFGEREVCEFVELLAARGIRRPLVWIYDTLHYQPLIDALPRAFRVYHATEDYLMKTEGWNQGMDITAQSVIKTLPHVDFMVAVTRGVAHSYVTTGGYRGASAVIENGCDAEYFIERVEKDQLVVADRPTAIFQGGINQRLDYRLLLALVRRMPDWDFRFCGAAVESVEWTQLLQEENVSYFGAMSPEQFTRHMCESTVGIIPYIQDQWIYNSLPLKAYEYVACGLPVVTVPINALERDAELFNIATSPDEFEQLIRRCSLTRHDQGLLEKRRRAALDNSYNSRFTTMSQRLVEAKEALAKQPKKLRVAILYDCLISMHVSTIRDHLEAFEKYSRHSITYIPATPEYWKRPAEEVHHLVDLSAFDVAIIHYSTRLSVAEHLDEGIARSLENFHGLKVLFIQDEYEGVELARSWMDRLKFDLVYTCVPQGAREFVYPSYRYPATEFVQTLTGYVPEDPKLEQYCTPLSERKVVIAYRGRKLPPIYGSLGHDKYRIGAEMKIFAGLRGIPVDIEVDDSKRIYGEDWYRFLGSARATLGTESGSNIFDYDGSIQREIERLQLEDPEIKFDELWAKVLGAHENHVRMNQISPKIFEAIRLRTALVLFEGEYSGVVLPDQHYIALKKDFSNVNDVLKKLCDDQYVQALTNRAYRDIVASGKYSYNAFIEAIDTDFDLRMVRSSKRHMLLAPLLTVSESGHVRHLLPALPIGLVSSAHPLGTPMSIHEMASLFPSHADARDAGGSVNDGPNSRTSSPSMLLYRGMRWGWHHLPLSLRDRIVPLVRAALQKQQEASPHRGMCIRAARRGWHMLPLFARLRLVRLLNSTRGE